MKEYSKTKEFIAVILISILLTFLSGCTSTKIISTSDLPQNSGKYAYIVHCETLKFLLGEPVISNDTLSGRIKLTYMDKSSDSGNKIHLYLSSDSVIKIDKKGEYLNLPLAEVTKVELNEVHGLVVPFILLGLGVGVAFLWAIIYAANNVSSQL